MDQVKLHTSKPPLYSFPIFANILSITSIHESFEAWYFSNFIQLNASPMNHTLSFYDCWSYLNKCPLIIRNSIDRWIINEKWNGDIISFLIDALNQSAYIYLFIDEAKLSNSTLSKKFNSFTHDVMVHGYNQQKKEFFISGSFESGKYIMSTCTFDEMRNAYINTDLSKDWLHGVQLIRLNTQTRYQLYTPYIKEQLSDYIYSRNSAIKIEDQPYYHEYFGLKVYSVLSDYLLKLVNGSLTKLLIRPFHFLYEHKKCMMDRITYFELNNIFTAKDDLEEIKFLTTEVLKKTLIQRNLFLKYIIKRDAQFLLKIRNELKEIRSMEERAIYLLIKSI